MIPGSPQLTRSQCGVSAGYAAILLGLLVSLGLLAACGDDSDDADAVDPVPDATETPDSAVPTPAPDPTATPEPQIDIETLAEEAGCDITTGIAVNEPWLTEVSPVWMKLEDRSVARSGPGPFQVHDSTWHTGQERIVWHVSSEQEVDDSIEVTGRNLDSGAELTPAPVGLTYQVPDGVIAIATVEFPEEGCWQISIGDVEVVSYVLPEEQRPDVRAGIEYREQVTPYEIPESCDATGWAGPSTHQGLFAAYSLPDSEPPVLSTSGLFFAGQNQLFVVTEDADLTVTGQNVDNPAMTPRSDVQLASGGLVPLVEATLDFPIPGCWDLEVEVEGETIGATIYVYPEECRREPGDDLPAGCVVPE